jgi:hypothetical protein
MDRLDADVVFSTIMVQHGLLPMGHGPQFGTLSRLLLGRIFAGGAEFSLHVFRVATYNDGYFHF